MRMGFKDKDGNMEIVSLSKVILEKTSTYASDIVMYPSSDKDEYYMIEDEPISQAVDRYIDLLKGGYTEISSGKVLIHVKDGISMQISGNEK